MEIFAARLKELRENKKMTQKQIAEAFGMEVRSYQNYELAKSTPKFALFITIADYFNVSLDYLVGRSDTPIIQNNKSDTTLLETNIKDNSNISKEFEYAYSQLSDDSKKELQNYLHTLYLNEQYEKNNPDPTDLTSTKKTKNIELADYTDKKQA